MDYLLIDEGLVRIKIPQYEKVSSKAPVYYNPAMELNRDLSVAAITAYRQRIDEDIAICDAFTGSGIRGIRYSKEIEGVSMAVVNDLNPLAVELARDNIANNGLDNVHVCREDANLLLRKCRGKFDVVDIDPFGTPAPYVESAASSLKAGGLICVTATDTSALCGTYKKPCIRKYGAKHCGMSIVMKPVLESWQDFYAVHFPSIKSIWISSFPIAQNIICVSMPWWVRGLKIQIDH
jgi:tRNA (guanine26-N2/guanine27-N2)-dimethyltransferase